MQRNEFLTLCREIAKLESGIYGIKLNIPNEYRVVFNGIEYYPLKYEMSFDKKGSVVDTAVLHDLKTNSIMYVPMKDVKIKEEI